MLSEAALMNQNTAVRLFTTPHGCIVLSVHCDVVMNYDLEGHSILILFW